MVKALLLVLDYLQNQQFNEFSFTNKSLEDANIVTFGRAKNNKSDNDTIEFQFFLESFLFTIEISGNNDDTSARVDKLTIFDKKENLEIKFDYLTKQLNIQKSKFIDFEEAQMNNRLILVDLFDERTELEKIVHNPNFKKSTNEALKQIDHLNKLKNQIEKLEKEINSKNDKTQYFEELFDKAYELKEDVFLNMTEETVIQELISDYFYQNNIAHKNAIENRDKEEDEFFETTGYFLENMEEIIENHKVQVIKSVDSAIKAIRDIKIYYLGANPSKQSALFSIRDKQNNLAQAIHDFKQSKILKGEKEYEFVKYWMNEFEVGQDFEIEFYAGEAYEFYVFDKEGFKAHLADKGMGSLQAMMLILRVATIMRKHKKTMKYVTIIVEEPELNLHPALQSKLASFFHTVNREYGIEFIIETHSEYLIRKAQLFVAENEYTTDAGLNPNPFKVNYFDLENGPYQMNFTVNGKFDRNFGEGFYDEASKNTLALLQNQRKKD
jgi:hypothetical protein